MTGDPDPKSPIPTGGNRQSEGGGRRYVLRERVLAFALNILRLTARIPPTAEGKAIRRQLARSGPSIGANVEEADGAVSRADKRRIFGIARREAQETRYWLKILNGLWSDRFPLAGELGALDEIIRILSAIIERLGAPKPE